MSDFWTSPFDFFKDQPADIATRLRQYDLRARAYGAMSKYWTVIFRALRAEKPEKDLLSDAISATKDFYDALYKVFQKFKVGEVYNELHPLEQLGDKFGKQAHKMVLGSEMVSNAALKDIQEYLEGLWDDFWKLTAQDDSRFDLLMTKFSFDSWAAMGLAPDTAPTWGSTVQAKADAPQSNASDASASASSNESMKLMGKGNVTYVPVVVKKDKVEAMIPSDVLSLEPIGLGLKDDEHLVIFALAKQTIDFGGGNFVSYQEVFPIVPNISLYGIPNQLFQAVPVLWVSELLIAKGARDYWKINKLFGKFAEKVQFPVDAAGGLKTAENKLTTSLEDENGIFHEEFVLSAKLSAHEKSYSAKDLAAFGPLQKMLGQTMVYWQGLDYYTAGFKIDFEKAVVNGATAEIKVGKQYGMPKGEHKVESLENNAVGAFSLKYDWVFDLPSPYPQVPGA